MNFYKETIRIFHDHVTAPTREKELRRLFMVSGEAPGTPIHSLVAGIFKAKLPESETETKLRALVGTTIEDITPIPTPNSEVEVAVNMILAKLGLEPREVDPEAAEKARLARMYPSMLGPEPPAYDPLEGYSTGEREIVENFYGSGETKTFGFQDGTAHKPQDKELETLAQGLYPTMQF
jgi:hypothetical protein